MATKHTQDNSRRSPTPPQQIPAAEDTLPSSPPPPSHPPPQYDDPQRFRDYAHAIDFEDDDFSTDDMFANPTPLPQLEIPSIISAAEQFQQQQARSHPPARGTGLGKTEGRSQKRARFDTPQPDRKESLDDEGDRPQKRVRFDMPRADEENGRVHSVNEDSNGEPVKPQRLSEEENREVEGPGDEGDSSDDCAWSLDSGVGGGDEGEKAQDANASSKHDRNVAREFEQRKVEAETPFHQS